MSTLHDSLTFSETGDASSSQAAPSTPAEIHAAMTGYCNQLISPELNSVVADMLQRLRILQDHALCFKPFKGEPQRWYVRGLREVRKAARQQKAKSIIMAPNIEQVEVKGGSLSSTVNSILATCKENSIPVVFALSRKKMGDVYGCHKRMSAIAIIDTTGIEDLHSHILQLMEDLSKQWEEQYQLWKTSQEEAVTSGQPPVYTPSPLMRFTQSMMLDDACSNSSGSPTYRAASDDIGGQHGFHVRVGSTAGSVSSDMSGRPGFQRQLRAMGPGMMGPSDYMQAAGMLPHNRPVTHPEAWARHGAAMMSPSAMMPHAPSHISAARRPGLMTQGPVVEWRYAQRPHAAAPGWHAGMHPQMVMQGPRGPVHTSAIPRPGGAPPVDVDACLANLAGLSLDTASGSMPAVQVRFEGWPDSSSTSNPEASTPGEVEQQHVSGKNQGRHMSDWQAYPGSSRTNRQWQPAARHYQVPGAVPHPHPSQMREGYPLAISHPGVPIQGAEVTAVPPALHPPTAPGMMGTPHMHGGYYTMPHPHAMMQVPSGVSQDHMVGYGEYAPDQWSSSNNVHTAVPQPQGQTVMMAHTLVRQEQQQMVYLLPQQPE